MSDPIKYSHVLLQVTTPTRKEKQKEESSLHWWEEGDDSTSERETENGALYSLRWPVAAFLFFSFPSLLIRDRSSALTHPTKKEGVISDACSLIRSPLSHSLFTVTPPSVMFSSLSDTMGPGPPLTLVTMRSALPSSTRAASTTFRCTMRAQ